MLPPFFNIYNYVICNRLRILMYHRIADDSPDRLTISPKLFQQEMEYLAANGFHVISLQEARERLAANADLKKQIALTFDDGYLDFLTNAAPILRQLKFSATLFIVTGAIGSHAHWSSVDKRQRLLDKEQLLELRAQGFQLGSHTVTHPDLTAQSDSQLADELKRSRDAVCALGETFVPFAYPGGSFTRRERDAVERAGYACAVIVGGRWGNGRETDRFLLKREPMLASDSLAWFKKRVNGYYEGHYLWGRARGMQTR